MPNRPFTFSHIFHAQDSLLKRKAVFEKYARKYHVSIYRLNADFGFPEVLYAAHYQDQEFLEASGLVVGNELQGHLPDPKQPSCKLPGYYHSRNKVFRQAV